MALIHLNHFSQALGKCAACFVVVPDGKGPFPVVYLLHGHSDDYTIWQRRTSIERYAARHGIMVVMPDGGRGWYSDALDGISRYESHILETVTIIENLLPARTDRAGRGIGGLSMGGYGSLKLALKHPRLFASVVSHSGALDMATWHRSGPRTGHLQQIFGKRLSADEDCFKLATKVRAARLRPRVRIDCGTDDFLIEHNRSMHRHLDRIGYAHEYEEFPGAHTWEYWDQHIQSALAFHAQGFAAKTTTRALRKAVSK